MSSRGMKTRSTNSNVRPGLAAAHLERQVAMDRRAKRKGPAVVGSKEMRRAEAMEESVKRIAALEREMAAQDATMDATPRPPAAGKRKRLQRTESIILGMEPSEDAEAPTSRPEDETETEAATPKQKKGKKNTEAEEAPTSRHETDAETEAPTPKRKEGKKNTAPSEAEEAPTSRPETETEAELSLGPKQKKGKKKDTAFRQAVEEVQAQLTITDLQRQKLSSKATGQPKPRPVARRNLQVKRSTPVDLVSTPKVDLRRKRYLDPASEGENAAKRAKKKGENHAGEIATGKKQAPTVDIGRKATEKKQAPTADMAVGDKGRNRKGNESEPEVRYNVKKRLTTNIEGPRQKSALPKKGKRLQPPLSVDEYEAEQETLAVDGGFMEEAAVSTIDEPNEAKRKNHQGRGGNGQLGMLTLDPITLFFHTLSEQTRNNNPHDNVAGWIARVTRPRSDRSGSVPSLTTGRSQTTRTSVTFASSKQIDLKVTKGKNKDEEHMGLSDCDETFGTERDAALSSPIKLPKVRATSVSLVAVKPGRVRPTNRVLPRQLLAGNALRGRFLPTTYQWLGTSEDPFRVDDHSLRDALLLIVEAIYGGNIDHGLEDVPEDDDAKTPAFVKSPFFRVIHQRLSEWRSGFGSAAIAALTTFFDDEPNAREFDTDEARREFAKYQLDHYRFLYREAEGDNRKNFRGKFLGPFLIPAFSVHFSSIGGATHTHGLYPQNVVPFPHAALAMAVTAVERVLTCWREGTITIERVREAQESGKNVKLKEENNPATGKISNRGLIFSDANWGDTARAWLFNIKAAKPANLQIIMEAARQFERVSQRTQNSSVDDERAYIPDSDGDT